MPQFRHNTPTVYGRDRLWYNTKFPLSWVRPYDQPAIMRKPNLYGKIVPKIILTTPEALRIQIVSYRFFRRTFERYVETGEKEFGGYVEKNEFVELLFEGHPGIHKINVSRILTSIVDYRLHFQINPWPGTNTPGSTNWRWHHILEMVYGLEHLMFYWLPAWLCHEDSSSCTSQADYLEELEILRDQNPDEDSLLIRNLVSNIRDISFR